MVVSFCLALALAVGTPDPVEQARKFVSDLEYDKAIELLADRQTMHETEPEHCYLLAVSYYATNRKDECQKWLTRFDDSFGRKERRHNVMVGMMQDAVTAWKMDLNDIGRDMRISGDRLETAKGGETTQDVQKRILDKLDKRIKEEEDKANKPADMTAKSPPDSRPKHQSDLPQEGPSEGKVDDVALQNIAKVWGTLPEAERIKIAQKMTLEAPIKYKAYIEAYFKALNDAHSK